MPDDPELIPTNFDADVRFRLDTYDPVDDYLNRLSGTLSRISREEIHAVIDVLLNAWKKNQQIFILGNGGSAATATHMANDLCKLTAQPSMKRLKAMSLTDNVPLMTAWGNDKSFRDIFSEQLINFVGPGDIVIGISVSGNSPNVLRALEVAAEFGAVRVGFTGKDGGRMKNLVDYCVFIPDEHLGRQEDCHLIMDHVITNTLRWMIAGDYE